MKQSLGADSARQPSLLVIGPGKDFGADLLARFGTEGFALGMLTRSADTSTRIERDLEARKLKVCSEITDIRDELAFRSAIQRLGDRLRGIDCLIYNAKTSVRGSSLTTSPDALHDTLRVNATGALTAIQAALPYMSSDNQPRVIVTGGGFKDNPDSTRLALSVGKAALHALVRASTVPLHRRGIYLRTVIFNGPVRDGGPIAPTEIADFFWRVFLAHKGSVFRYSRHPQEEPTLFADRLLL